MNWTADELRQLRYRLGWSCAEMARTIGCELEHVMAWEAGRVAPHDAQRNNLLHIYYQAELNAEKVARRPVAEVLMNDRNLAQIHDMDVVDCLADGSLRSFNFKIE